MIDSGLGIYKKLERLVALERVDVRHNQVEESGEGNAFTEIESDYRVKCFDFSWKEGKSILLDGTLAGFYERRSLTSPPPEQMNSTRPMSKVYLSPVVPVGGATTAPALAVALAPSTTAVTPVPSSGASSSCGLAFSPALIAPTIAVPPCHQRQAPENAREAGRAPGRRPGERERVDHGLGGAKRAYRLSHFGVALSARRTGVVTPRARDDGFSLAPIFPAEEDSTTPKAPDVVPPKHRRSHTEYAPAPALALADSDGPPSPVLVRPPPDRTMSVRVSARWSAARRARAAASVFEAPGKVEDGVGEEIKEADAFRARVEALRSEVGDG
ncbi:hypothetical protein EDB86DRAFT_2836947 [Lactarius hatsudake]|nr:hypothetical protein EDB86DRAFT_2836947 [Lactarius hatsudake]